MSTRKRVLALLAATTLTASLAVTAIGGAGAQAQPGSGGLIINGDFSNGTDPWWWTGNLAAEVVDGQLCTEVPGGTVNPWDAILGQSNLALVAGQAYAYQVTATASRPVGIRALVHQPVDPFPSQLDQNLILDTEPQTFSFSFVSDADWTDAEVAFQVGGQAEPWTLCLDDVSLTSEVEHLVNGDFSDGTEPWFWTGNLAAEVVDGQLCTEVPGGTINPWDAIIGQNPIVLQSGENYRLRFTASADPPAAARALVQRPVDPFPTELDQTVPLGPEPEAFDFTFTSDVDWTDAEVAFQIGGQEAPWTFCLDDVSLTSGAEPPDFTPDTGPRVRVNQVGYLPQGPKHATIVTEATEPLEWELHDAAGELVTSGTSTPFGLDESSGENVHTVDFSGVTTVGSDFTLSADGETSYPFAISGDIYQQLRLDALKFYYPQRSGIEILDELRPGYGRPAGHIQVPPNQGDLEVPCFEDSCDYTLDVSGGWYDAGDHGKYVVNSGISVWELMHLWERANLAPTGDPTAFADGSLDIPESGNGVPDILDEVRWNLEFMLSMQVPEGEEPAGMVHHKIHDENWTGLPLLPHNDPEARFVHPPSTAATLNLAAAGAQCGRVFADIDPAFAQQCLDAAERAWDGAVANPDIIAPAFGNGGGSYSEGTISDEFYWAAAELFLTTGAQEYADAVLGSELHLDPWREGGFDWGWTAPAGALALVTVPNDLPGLADVEDSVVAAAADYLANVESHPYGISYAPADGQFVWGSNHLVLNILAIVATAYDLTGDVSYRDGVLTGIDYILGRNAMNNSYVTGYGTVSSQNQHSRWYAAQLNPNLPNPPAGSLAGGPNSFLQDPVAEQQRQGCAAQFCYVDDIGSFSTNELTINWNAAIAWVASFVAEQGDGSVAPVLSCTVDYRVLSQWGSGFLATVTVRNTGEEPVEDWSLAWSFSAGQQVQHAWNASVTQSGADVVATSTSWNRSIAAGRSAEFGFIGQNSAGSNPTPAAFVLNGSTCS